MYLRTHRHVSVYEGVWGGLKSADKEEIACEIVRC